MSIPQPIDDQLRTILAVPAGTVPDVIARMQAMDAVLPETDGLKWFNWLYLQVTLAVETSIPTRSWNDPAWLTSLDVNFANLYFDALRNYLNASPTPGCWRVLFDARQAPYRARIQFAIAGINSHINHDLPQAVVTTCRQQGVDVAHGSPQYQDYTAVNSLLDSLVETAKHELLKGPLGEDWPGIDRVEQLVAGFNVMAARETSWTNAEILWTLRGSAFLSQRYLDSLDGVTALTNRGLLVRVV